MELTTKLDKDFIKSLRDKFCSPEYAEKQYQIYKNQIPAPNNYVTLNLRDQLIEYLHACTYWIIEIQKGLFKAKDKINNVDLNLLLNTNVDYLLTSEWSITHNQAGLKFLDSFIYEDRLSTLVTGGSKKNILQVQNDYIFVYKAMVKMLEFGDNFDESSMKRCLKIRGVQVVSNFRPTAAAVMWKKLGLEKTSDKEIFLRCPSEGWLGRLLSTYYLAARHRDRNFHYISTDPNLRVCEKFDVVVDYLKNFGGLTRITNWFPKIYCQGSEGPESQFSTTEDLTFHVTGTSPPYFGTEQYLDTLIINKDIRFSEEDEVPTSRGYLNPAEVRIGDELADGTIVKELKWAGQSRKHSTPELWNENFLRPTFKNQYKDLKTNGYMWINIAKVKTDPTIEEDTIRIAKEEGFELERTGKYILSRVPGAKHKEPGEPIFIFRKIG